MLLPPLLDKILCRGTFGKEFMVMGKKETGREIGGEGDGGVFSTDLLNLL